MTLVNDPGGQGRQLEAPKDDEKKPGGHAWHVALLLAPVTLENVPTEHVVHAVTATEALYVPGLHAVHDDEPGELEKLPAGHAKQFASAVLKDAGDMTCPMMVQEPMAAPPLPMTNGKALYVPLGHCRGAVIPMKGQ